MDLTLARYEKKTGLTLHDVREAFGEGNWGQPPSFGGPKWAAIAGTTIELGEAIHQNNWSEVERLTVLIGNLPHNNGHLVDKFAQLN